MKDVICGEFAALRRYEEKINSLYHDIAVKAGISDTALLVLYCLCETDRVYTQYEIADEWMFPRQTINSAISRLADIGYLTLAPIAGTRNSKSLALTEAGKDFCKDHVIPILQAEQHFFSGLPSADREKYLELRQGQYASLEKEFRERGLI